MNRPWETEEFFKRRDEARKRFPMPPKTNASRLRQMTDEELAKWIELHESTAWCPFDPISDKEVDPVTRECLHHDACWMCVLDWLKSPVEEEQT